ncbi:MAG: ATP-binding cassette domain-containing protein [Planctomycetota bacterium]
MTNQSNSSAVSVRDLSFAYGERKALDSVQLEVPVGEVRGVLGPNGSGKSTLFRILATILPAPMGTVSVLGHDVAGRSPELLSSIGVVFQSAALDRKLTVRENLRYGGRMFGLRGSELDQRIDEMLERTNLGDRAATMVEELSGGLRRRAEIAKGLLHRPKLLLLDEPSTGLDPGARRDLWSFVRSIDDVTVVFTTHLMDEADAADRLTLFDEGRVVAEGTPDELRARIGGDVLEIEADDHDAVRERVRGAFDLELVAHGAVLRAETSNAPEQIGRMLTLLGDSVRSIRVGRPSLEDVFLHETGHRLDVVDPEADTGSKRSRRKKRKQKKEEN